MDNLKQIACSAIDNAKESLHQISKDIWEHPEESFEEVFAHATITQFLEKHGFTVEKNFVVQTGFRTVFESRDDSPGPNIAVLCEYDALPQIGHACGHNLIAEVGLAAGIGIRDALKASGIPRGKVGDTTGSFLDTVGNFQDGDRFGDRKLTILGTPAEEGSGGKLDMITAGAFKDVDVAMMAHPYPHNRDVFNSLAIEDVTVKYHGKAAHASAFPWDGINALDAAVLAYQNVSCMRQQLKTTWRVHGVIHNGGAKPNIIPELTELEFYARTPSRKELEELKSKLDLCFQSAATATGCRAEIMWTGRPCLDVINNKVVSDLYHTNACNVGIDFSEPSGDDGSAGSTDMGNVSYVVPSIHPMFYIGTDEVNHTRGFTAASGADKAQPYTLTVAKALAMTAIDIYTQPETLNKIKHEFDQAHK